MTTRIGLRARLTIFVTVAFGAATSVTAILALRVVEDRLVDDTRASAEAVLSNYLASIYGGVATVGVVAPDDSTRFFYLDADGNEITEREYFGAIGTGFVFELAGSAPGGSVLTGDVTVDSGGPVAAVAIDPDTGVVHGPGGEAVVFRASPIPSGEPHAVDRGDDVVAVAQTLTFADDVTIAVGVSNPLEPVTDSLDAVRALLWVAVPALVAATAAITWLAASRALRPVQAIIDRTQAITASNINQRVPVHAGHDEIHDLAVTVNGMLDRLEDAQHRQHRLVADASHELRSPVAASRAQLDVAAANPTTTDWAATTRAVLVEQEHLSNLIEGLLALSRLDEARPDNTVDVDLDDLIAGEAARLGDVRVVAPEPVRVKGNPALLTRAVRNLIDNATRHARQETCVALSTRPGVAVIDVDDDGPGVPPGRREEIFERFTRLDEARDRESGGAGLGLAIAREVARAHHGDVVCTESPMGGARFTLTIADDRSCRPADAHGESRR